MRYSNISITLPPGYAESLDQESSRYGLNRSEFIRVQFDAYLLVAFRMTERGERGRIDTAKACEDFFPEVLPHRKAEAGVWLEHYLELVIRIVEESGQRKRTMGHVDRDNVYELLPSDDSDDVSSSSVQ